MFPIRRQFFKWLLLLGVFIFGLTACTLPRVTAEQRIFLNLSLEFLGEYRLPKLELEGTPVGGLSAIAYDRQTNRFYALSDDRGDLAPARFYTLNLVLGADQQMQRVEVEKVTFLRQEDRTLYPKGTINAEGLALSPQRSLFVASEGATQTGIQPFINEFELETGAWRQSLPIPKRYLADATAEQPQGVPDNLGFESLTINPGSYGSTRLEPFRVFVATETPLLQDQFTNQAATTTQASGLESPTAPAPENNNRFLHYLIGEGPPVLISEHIYPLSAGSPGSLQNGLTELLALDQGGHFLGLERAVTLQGDLLHLGTGYSAQIFQLATGGATDTSTLSSLPGNLAGVEPIRKQLLLDLSTLQLPLENLEGMTLGPRLSDGSQSLLLISDDNFKETQTTQFLLFRLGQASLNKASSQLSL